MLASISTLKFNWIIYKVLQKRRMKTRGKHFKLLLSSVHSSLNFDWGRAKRCNGTDFLFLHSFLACETLIISGAPRPFLRLRKDLRRFIERFAGGLDNFSVLDRLQTYRWLVSLKASCFPPAKTYSFRNANNESLFARYTLKRRISTKILSRFQWINRPILALPSPRIFTSAHDRLKKIRRCPA